MARLSTRRAGAAVRPLFTGAAIAAALMATPAFAQTNAEKAAVIENYANIAEAAYGDAASTARVLQGAVTALIAKPSGQTLDAARKAWRAARVPYMQTEAFRFGNPIIDDWEGNVNAWPLDEGLIDYVDSSYGTDSDENPLYTANVIANGKITQGGKTINADPITWRTLRNLEEVGGVEANVSTGYHAIEFLLWGQDLHGTGPGAGERPATDYAKGAACTNGHCDRRADYLRVATQLLVDDLAYMTKQWAASGAARTNLTKGEPDKGISVMLTGLGSLSYGELAGERTKLGLMLHDPEEEQDCFSDNTYNSHYYDVVGIHNVWVGSYTRVDGKIVKGPSLESLAAKADEAAAKDVTAKMAVTMERATTLKQRGETVEAYDQMLAENNPEGNAVLQGLVDGLTDQTHAIERVVAALKLGSIQFEGSKSLDSPDDVFAK
ncbi:MAG TPA: imelysin family protein [Alphaproteobacteria bacterium]